MRDLLRAVRLLQVPPGRALAAVAAGVAALGSAVALIGVSGWLIMRAWQMPPVLDLTVAVVAVRALGIGRGVFRYLERLASHEVALRGMGTLRTGVYDRLAAGDPAAAARAGRGGLLTQLGEDVDALGDLLVRALLPAAVALAVSAGAVVAVAFVAPVAALVLAAALLVAGVAAPALSARAGRRTTVAAARHRQASAAAALTALDHAAELRVAGRWEDMLALADREQRAAVAASDRGAGTVAAAAAATPLAVGASVLGALLVGAGLHASGAISPMALAVATLLPLVAFEATAALPEAAAQLNRSAVAARRVGALLDAAGDGRPPAAPGEGAAVAAADLRWGWPGQPAAGPLTLAARPGERVAIVGPSGVGKTTLLMTLAGLLEPRGGTATAGHCRFLAEDAHLFHTTVRDNLLVARGDATDADLLAALGQVGLGPWLQGLPDGLGTVLVGGAAAVSGGQRRRLLLARALIADARVLLLDEPTEHLDAQDAERFLTALLDRGSGLLDPGRTVVLVTHHLPQRTRADQVIALG